LAELRALGEVLEMVKKVLRGEWRTLVVVVTNAMCTTVATASLVSVLGMDDQLLDRFVVADEEEALGEFIIRVISRDMPSQIGQGRVSGDGKHEGW